jgi:Actin like proteins N terminal domain
VGFGNTKACYFDEVTNQKILFKFPSVISLIPRNFDLDSFESYTNSVGDFLYAWDADESTTFCGGSQIFDQPYSLLRVRAGKFWADPINRILTTIGAAHCCHSAGRNVCNLTLGLPVDDFNTSDAVEYLVEKIPGKYRLKNRNGDFEFTIKDVHVVPQPLGSLKAIPNNPIFSGHRSLILDVGSGTIDWITVHRGVTLKPLSGTYRVSTAEFIDRFNYSGLSIETADFELKNRAVNGEVTRYKGQTIPTDKLRLARDRDLQIHLKRLVPSIPQFEMIDNILVTGGAAASASIILQKIYPNLPIFTAPHLEFQNVIGFYEYAKIRRESLDD